jgi:cyclic pyranopterin phosphate synthase
MKARVHAVSTSEKKGMQKSNVESAVLKEGFGIVGDAHAGNWHRQVSLLALESIKKMQDMGLDVDSGDFAENITTLGIDLIKQDIGARLKIGSDVILKISQKGKECHDKCAIYHQAGDCVMPREGIFAEVEKGGTIRPNDVVEVLNDD